MYPGKAAQWALDSMLSWSLSRSSCEDSLVCENTPRHVGPMHGLIKGVGGKTRCNPGLCLLSMLLSCFSKGREAQDRGSRPSPAFCPSTSQILDCSHGNEKQL